MLTFTLAIPYLTTSNLPWFLCSIALYSIRPCFYHQLHPQLGVLFLWLCLFILSGVISPFFSNSILGTYWPGEFICLCRIVLPFHTVHGILKARILKWFAISFSSGPHSVRTMDRDSCIVQETGIKTIPKIKNWKKAKWLSEETLQIAVKRREAKIKGEKERYTHLNAELQRIARRDKKDFLSDQCKEIEENNK